MKAIKDLRGKRNLPAAEENRSTWLDPIRKSGKEKRSFLREIEDEEELELIYSYRKKESVLDYFDDGDEDSEEEDWDDGDEEYDDPDRDENEESEEYEE